MNIKKQFKEGLITNNPVLVQLIGMCATMAITTSLFNGEAHYDQNDAGALIMASAWACPFSSF